MADEPSSVNACLATFDRWIAEARARLVQAQDGGDPSCIAAARSAVEELEASRLQLTVGDPVALLSKGGL